MRLECVRDPNYANGEPVWVFLYGSARIRFGYGPAFWHSRALAIQHAERHGFRVSKGGKVTINHESGLMEVA